MAAETGTEEAGGTRVVVKIEAMDEEITIKEEFLRSDFSLEDAIQTAEPGLDTSSCLLAPENVKQEPLDSESAGLNSVSEVAMHTSHAVEDVEPRPECVKPHIYETGGRIGKDMVPNIVVERQVDDPSVNDPEMFVEVKLEPVEDEAGAGAGAGARGEAGADTKVCVGSKKPAKRKAKKKPASDTHTDDTNTNDTHTNDTHTNDTHTNDTHTNDTHTNDTHADARKRSQGPHICQTCNKEFKKSNKLVLHMRTHTGERPYPCDICSKSFSYSNGLKVHLRTHSGERPHACQFCDQRFRQWNTLKAHERLHTGDKPYVCEICNKGFTQNNLKQHMLVHTKLKQHSCPVCEKKFKDAYSLRRHEPLHNNDRPYSCATCGKKFPSALHLRYHEAGHKRVKKALGKRKKK